jgi:hypothetical protein
MSFFWTKEHEVPPKVRDAIEEEFLAPDAKGPASKGELGGMRVFFQLWLYAFEKGFDESLAGIRRQLSALDTKAQKGVDLERLFATFDPKVYDGREPHEKRSMRMVLADGREAIFTSEIVPADGQSLPAPRTQTEQLEASIKNLTADLSKMRQQNSAMHARVAALEKKMKVAA